MARISWRRSLHLLQQQQRSLLPPLAATSRSFPAAPLSEELCSRTASWALWTREAHFSSRDHLSGGCTQVCGSRIGDDWGMANGRRSFHATGIQRMSRQNFYETSGLQKGASAKEINDAYYQVKKCHSDVNKGNADVEKKFQEIQQAYELARIRLSDVNKGTTDAEKKIQEIRQAYEALKDDEKRALYAQIFGKRAAGGAPGGSPGGCILRWIFETNVIYVWFWMSQVTFLLSCFLVFRNFYSNLSLGLK